jgi:hypothetical protein
MKLSRGEGRVGCGLAGKCQLRLVEPYRRLHEFDHVDHIRQIVENQFSQGLAVATPVPQSRQQWHKESLNERILLVSLLLLKM